MKMTGKEVKKGIGILFLCLCISIFLFLVPKKARSFLGLPGFSLGGPFGGKILVSINCSCTSLGIGKLKIGAKTTMIVVGPPKGGTFIKIPFVGGYEKGNLSIGHWVVGLASPGAIPCMVGKVPACVPAGYGSPIISVGTN